LTERNSSHAEGENGSDQEGDLSKEQPAQRGQEVFDDPGKRQLVLDVSATISQVGRKAGYDTTLSGSR
jgi:hypothetical protein